MKRTGWSRLVFWLPSLLGVGLFYLLPLIAVAWNAFGRGIGAWCFVGSDNFIRLFENTAFRLGSRNSLIFTFTAVPSCVTLSLCFALLLEDALLGKGILRGLLLCPVAVPAASAALVCRVIFSWNGLLNSTLIKLGLERIDWLSTGWAGGVLGLLFCWKTAGCGMVLFAAALVSIPQEILDAARLDGAGSWILFWRIKLPYLAPTIGFVTLFTVMNSFKIFRETYLLAGDYPAESLYTLQHFFNNAFRNLDLTKLSTGAAVISALVLMVSGIIVWTERRLGKDVEE